MSTHLLPGFTLADGLSLRRAMQRTWDVIASDCINGAREFGGAGTLDQDDVIDLVLDSDHILTNGGIDRNVYKRFMALPTEDMKAFAKTVFRDKYYS
jgi:hypothetical protein